MATRLEVIAPIIYLLFLVIPLGVQFENSSEVGVFSLLTSTYCLVPENNHNFLSVFEGEIADSIPVIPISFAGTKIIGRLCTGLFFSFASSGHICNIVFQETPKDYWFHIQQLMLNFIS